MLPTSKASIRTERTQRCTRAGLMLTKQTVRHQHNWVPGKIDKSPSREAQEVPWEFRGSRGYSQLTEGRAMP